MMSRRSTFGTSAFTLLCLAAVAVVSVRAQNQPAAAPNDGLDLRFANGIAAIVETKVITVDDIRREIQPLIAQLQTDSHNEKEFNEKLEALQDDVIQNLIDRELIVKDFQKDEKKHIPDSFVDNRISEIQAEQFDNDRSKFLAYLRQRGTTLREYRKEVSEEIILGYMRQQQRKSQSIVSPVKIETFYNENKDRFYQEDRAHMRMLQLTRNPGESDEALTARLNEIVVKFKAGEKFEDLARSYSQEPSRRAKGGDWGWMKRSDLKPEFSEPLFKLKAGEMTEPLLLPEAGYLLFVEEREYSGIEPIDKVRDQIERILVQKMATVSQEHWLERLRRNGYIKHY
jgi:peptidyl-prolyl cis-trans isomerase SurA